jgi:O-antigen/teichoic acid export membrane protein
LVVAVAPEFLTLWLDADFGTFSTPVMKLLAIGIFLHSLAYVPMSLLQASGRPDLTAKLNLIELPVYVVVSSLLIRHFGIVGAASAWLLRAGVDMYFSTRFALRIMDRPGACVRRLFWMITGNLVGLAMLALPLPVLLRLAGVILLSLAHIRISWRWLLEDGDRLRMTQHYAVAREKIFQLLSHFKSDTNPES